MIVDNLLSQIDKGREGANWALSMGSPKLENYIDGLSLSTYFLLFSSSGVGKTSLALRNFIYEPIKDNINDLSVVEFHFISLEMKAEVLLAKLLSMYIFETFGVEITYKQLLSKTRNEVLSDDMYEYVKKSIPWMRKVESVLHIYDKSLNSAKFFDILKDIAANNGKFYEDNARTYYTPNNPNKVILVIIDHLSLTTPSAGKSLKNEMDDISKIAVQFRNRCQFSFLVIMQANRESSSTDRRKLELLEPQRSDLKDLTFLTFIHFEYCLNLEESL